MVRLLSFTLTAVFHDVAGVVTVNDVAVVDDPMSFSAVVTFSLFVPAACIVSILGFPVSFLSSDRFGFSINNKDTCL